MMHLFRHNQLALILQCTKLNSQLQCSYVQSNHATVTQQEIVKQFPRALRQTIIFQFEGEMDRLNQQ